MVVLNPIKLVITNYPEGQTEMMSTINNPEDEGMGEREMPFGKCLYIEREDFMEDPPKKFFRLGPGRHVRLKNAFIVRCDDFVKNEAGELTEVRVTYFPESRSGSDTSGIKTKGTLHWVSADHAVPVEVRLYDRLFSDPNPMGHEGRDFKEFINSDSLQVLSKAMAEPAIQEVQEGEYLQFLRKGYFYRDSDSSADHLIFNRTVGLRDAWAKIAAKKK